MELTNINIQSAEVVPAIHWGHFGAVLAAMVLLLGVSFMEKPELFSFGKSAAVTADAQNVPHYYAYVPPPEDQPQPEVLGASTNQGPQIINDDGTVSPVDMGQVLGASTQDVKLNPDEIKVKTIPDSPEAITNYLNQVQTIENGPIDNGDFETALTSNNQDSINQQANKIMGIRDSLQKLPVPVGFTKWQQLNVIQYDAAIGLLQNFTLSDSNPQLVGQYFEQFLKSQQDLQTEGTAVAAKYNLNPLQLTAGLVNISSPGSGTDAATASDGSQNNLGGNGQ